MADPAKSQQPSRRKKTVSRGKERKGRTNRPSARRKQSKSSQIDLFDEEMKISKEPEKKKPSSIPIVAAETTPHEVEAAQQAPLSLQEASPESKGGTGSEMPHAEPPRETAREVVDKPSTQTVSRFSQSTPEAGPRRLLRSQQQRAAKLRRYVYVGGGAFLFLLIALAVFLLLRGRTRTNIKPVTPKAVSEISPPATVSSEAAALPPSGETSDGVATTSETASPSSIEETQPEQAGEPTYVPDSQKHSDEPPPDAAIAETEFPSPSTAVTPEALPQEESLARSEQESSNTTQAMSEQSDSQTAPDEAAKTPSSEKNGETTGSPEELAMMEKPGKSESVSETGTAGQSGSETSKHVSAIDFSSPWTNSLGMQFVPLDNVLFSVWETRVRDFEAFCEATGRKRDRAPFEDSGDHPVSRVNWHDAQEFCAWLTEKERSEGILGSDQFYRLPTDLEWSFAAGLQDETGDTPEARDAETANVYPWGNKWPPPDGSANFADRSASSRLKSTVDSYNDGYLRSAPVGTMKANSFGIHDLSGNLWEWSQDAYGGRGRLRNWRVMRGGSWSTHRRKELLSSYRSVVNPDSRGLVYGFRCVVADEFVDK